MTDGRQGRPGSIPGWEKTVWVMIALYLLIAFMVFVWLGWSRLPFPI